MKKIILFTVSFILSSSSILFAQDNFTQADQENNYNKQRANVENRESRRQFRLKKSESESASRERRQEFKRKKEAIMKKCKKEIEKLRQEYRIKNHKNGKKDKNYNRGEHNNHKSDYKKRKYQNDRESLTDSAPSDDFKKDK